MISGARQEAELIDCGDWFKSQGWYLGSGLGS